VPAPPGQTPAVAKAERFARVAAGSGPVRSHDLLLGLLGDDDSLAAKVLESLGVSLEAVKERVGEISIAGSSDELPEEAGGRRVTVRVSDGRVFVEVDDADVADLLTQAIAGATGESGGDVVLTGEDPAADFALLWRSLRLTAVDILRRRAAAT
jgi:hypothetical protein